MLRLLPPTKNTLQPNFVARHDRKWAVKRAKSLFHLFCSNVAKQIVRFLLPVLPSLKILKSAFTILFFGTGHIIALALQLRL